MLDEVRDSDIARLWAKVRLTSGCWLWTAGTAKGYGAIRWKRNRQVQATRAVWEAVYGVEPEQDVLHHCDVKMCVRPSHLYLGSASQNANDAYDRTQPSGIHHPFAKLTYISVAEARTRYLKEDISVRSLAADYGVSYGVMNDALTGRTWKRNVAVAPITLRPRNWKRVA